MNNTGDMPLLWSCAFSVRKLAKNMSSLRDSGGINKEVAGLPVKWSVRGIIHQRNSRQGIEAIEQPHDFFDKKTGLPYPPMYQRDSQ